VFRSESGARSAQGGLPAAPSRVWRQRGRYWLCWLSAGRQHVRTRWVLNGVRPTTLNSAGLMKIHSPPFVSRGNTQRWRESDPCSYRRRLITKLLLQKVIPSHFHQSRRTYMTPLKVSLCKLSTFNSHFALHLWPTKRFCTQWLLFQAEGFYKTASKLFTFIWK